jgi:3-oxoacyl-[acyl-carrier protein] reductase
MVAGQQKEYSMNLGLSEKKVLITGSSQGIGRSIAFGFLEEGADVIIVSRGKEKLHKLKFELQERFGEGRILSFVCDCSDDDSLSHLNDFIVENWGVLDVVVANVGDGSSVSDVVPTNERWIKTWSSNFESALKTSRAFIPMLERSNGNLLFISSIAGLEAFGAPVDYSTAKTAVIAFAKNIARKLAKNVRVNVVAPGNVNFPEGVWAKKYKSNPKLIIKMIKDTVPMNRFGKPEEISDSVLFLCSERASFITGSVLVVDGGQTIRVI